MNIKNSQCDTDAFDAALSDKAAKKTWSEPSLKVFSIQNTEAKDTFSPMELSDTIGSS